jgi:hypothetical protein
VKDEETRKKWRQLRALAGARTLKMNESEQHAREKNRGSKKQRGDFFTGPFALQFPSVYRMLFSVLQDQSFSGREDSFRFGAACRPLLSAS